MKEFLKGKKTYIVSGLMVIIGLVNLFIGDVTLQNFLASEELRILLEGFGFATLRAGIAKK